MHPLRKLLDLIQLTKPRIMLLVTLSGAAALVMQGSVLHQPIRFVLVLIGLALAGGSANAFNQYFERDLDARMSRTRARRPLPLGTVTPGEALIFALLIAVSSVLLFGFAFNWLSAGIAAGTILFYSIGYTLWLKPRTYWNIVIGGAAGALAPVIAWAAAAGSVGWTAWILFLIIFFWTPPHFWALALCVKDDYAGVGLPMLPVIKGERETRRQILLYTFWMVGISLSLAVVSAGIIYLILALVLGAVFMRLALGVWQANDRARDRGLFRYSIIYLMTLFVAMIADSMAR